MGRIRSIHPGLWTDEEFVELSDKAMLFLIGLWGEADDHGVFEWRPLRLKMRLRAWDGTGVDDLIEELVAIGFIRKFDASGKPYGAIKNFAKWQRPKSPQYIHPTTPEILEYVRAEETRPEAPQRGTALGKMLCEKQSGKCFYCENEITFYRKKGNSLEVDHRIPVSRGGEDDISNLVAACKPCNSLKRDRTDVEFMAMFSKDDLYRRSCEKWNSQDAKENSQERENEIRSAKTGANDPAKIQREEGGGEDIGNNHPPKETPRGASPPRNQPKPNPKFVSIQRAAGWNDFPTDMGQVIAEWDADDIELDWSILPAIREAAAEARGRGGKQPFRLRFFDSAVREKHAERQREFANLERIRRENADAPPHPDTLAMAAGAR